MSSGSFHTGSESPSPGPRCKTGIPQRPKCCLLFKVRRCQLSQTWAATPALMLTILGTCERHFLICELELLIMSVAVRMKLYGGVRHTLGTPVSAGTGSWDLSCAQPSSSHRAYVYADIQCTELNAARVLSLGDARNGRAS